MCVCVCVSPPSLLARVIESQGGGGGGEEEEEEECEKDIFGWRSITHREKKRRERERVVMIALSDWTTPLRRHQREREREEEKEGKLHDAPSPLDVGDDGVVVGVGVPPTHPSSLPRQD